MDEIAAEALIRALLTGSGLLPNNTPVEPVPYDADGVYPAVVYKCVNANVDTIEIGADIVFSTLDFQVTVTAQGNNCAHLIQYIKGIHNSLNKKGGTNSYGTINMISRVRPFTQPYQSKDGSVWQNVGYVFRVRVQGNYS